MANLLQQAGAQSIKPPKFAPLWQNRYLTGLWLQRSPIRDPGTRVESIYYGGRSEALIAGVNVELTNALTLARRPGCTNFSPGNTVSEAINSFYAFKSFSTVSENIQVMMDGLTQIYTLTPLAITSIFTKGAGAGQASLFGINNTLYIGDGVDQVAWPGTGTVRNWGIAVGAGVGTTASAYAGAGTDGGASWTNPGNITGPPDGLYATANLTSFVHGSVQTSQLQATTYGFALAGTTVTQITANVTAHVSSLVGPNLVVNAQLLVNGTPTGTVVTVPISSTTDVILPFTFTTVVTDAQANLSVFGVQLQAANIFYTSGGFGGHSTGIINLDAAQIVISQIGATVGTPTGSGTLTTITGWKYVYEYTNSNSGAFSPATPVGASTGPFTNKASVNVPVVASTDPQVTGIYVFRTTDGGATFFSLPTNPYPNVTATIVDTNTDATLNTFALADIVGLNTPPPAGIGRMVFHMGRLWGSVNNVLYYAVGPDLGNILGNPYEGWPPANFFTLPSKITKLIPTSVGLLVHTVSDVYIVYGNASATAAATGVSGLNVFYVAPFIQAVGLLSQFAADVNGTTIYMVTADGQCLSIDPSSGVSEIGFPIGQPNVAYPNDPSLASFNPASSYVTWHVAGSVDKAVYVSDGATGWFRCNTSQAPEGGFVWSPKANIINGLGGTTTEYAGLGVDTGSSWTSPTNIEGSPDGAYATATLNQFPNQSTSQLQATQYGFALSGTTITQITAAVTMHVSGLTGPSVSVNAQLLVNGVPTGPISTVPLSSSTDTVETFFFSTAVTDTQANQTNFGIQLQAANVQYNTGTGTFYSSGVVNLDAAQIQIGQSGSVQAVQSIETTPGVRQLLMGPGVFGGAILFRDLTVYTDNGSSYPSNLTMGNIVLAYPGQIAEIDFITCDYNRVGTSPVVSVLLDEINGMFTNVSGYVHSDPPSIYGTTLSPATLYANRHDFAQTVSRGTPPPIFCRHLQIMIDFGATDTVRNELMSSTIYGAYYAER